MERDRLRNRERCGHVVWLQTDWRSDWTFLVWWWVHMKCEIHHGSSAKLVFDSRLLLGAGYCLHIDTRKSKYAAVYLSIYTHTHCIGNVFIFTTNILGWTYFFSSKESGVKHFQVYFFFLTQVKARGQVDFSRLLPSQCKGLGQNGWRRWQTIKERPHSPLLDFAAALHWNHVN